MKRDRLPTILGILSGFLAFYIHEWFTGLILIGLGIGILWPKRRGKGSGAKDSRGDLRNDRNRRDSQD